MKTIRFIIVITLYALINPATISGKDTTFLYGVNYRPVNDIKDAIFYKEIKNFDKRKSRVDTYVLVDSSWVKTKTERVKKLSDGNIEINVFKAVGVTETTIRKFTKQPDGKFLFHDITNGVLTRKGISKTKFPLCLDGVVEEYYIKGNLKSRSVYENNQLRKNENWLKDGTKYIDNYFYSVDKVPEYKLGYEKLREFVILSLEDKKVDLSQYNLTVDLGWVVMPDGTIQGVRVLEGSNYVSLNSKLVEIFSELPGEWKPARLNGKEVPYFMKFPVNLQFIDESGFEMVEIRGARISWD